MRVDFESAYVDKTSLPSGYFCGVPVVEPSIYANDLGAEIYIDGIVQPFVPMRGSKAGYMQRNYPHRANEWQFGFCEFLGRRWARAALAQPRKRVIFVQAKSARKVGFLGLGATCQDRLLEAAVSAAAASASDEFFDGAYIQNVYSDQRIWRGFVGILVDRNDGRSTQSHLMGLASGIWNSLRVEHENSI